MLKITVIANASEKYTPEEIANKVKELLDSKLWGNHSLPAEVSIESVVAERQ